MMASRNNNTSVSRNANGNRRSQFKLEAASSEDKPSTGPTYLIYVGKLSKVTTVNSVRDHLRQIGLPNEDDADVLQLKCKNINEKSLCVSIHSPSGKDKLYDPHNWPLGVRVQKVRCCLITGTARNLLQNEFLKQNNIMCVANFLFEQQVDYTYRLGNKNLYIDQIFIPKYLCNKVTECNILHEAKDNVSDHLALGATSSQHTTRNLVSVTRLFMDQATQRRTGQTLHLYIIINKT